MQSVLFVCTGNLCRSPIAEQLFKTMLLSSGSLAGWTVASAGTWTRDGLPVLPFSIKLAKQFGIDLRSYRTKMVTSLPFRKYDVIIVMEKNHKEALIAEFPGMEDRIMLLTTLSGQIPYDIKDPILQDEISAADIIQDMKECLEQAFPAIVSMAQIKRPDEGD